MKSIRGKIDKYALMNRFLSREHLMYGDLSCLWRDVISLREIQVPLDQRIRDYEINKR
jgi:hypothetical protein